MRQLVLLGDRNTEFVTHRELDAVLALLPDGVTAKWVGTDEAQAERRAAEADALWVVPGSPYKNDAVVYAAIGKARVSGQPFLGTCGGFQYTVVEFARNVAGIGNAEHAETAQGVDGGLVVDRLACSLVGEERMVTAVRGTKIYGLMGATPFVGFHWCNYGLAAGYVERLVESGLVVSAHAPDAGVEAVEIGGHPFFMATLFQPQVGALAGGEVHSIIRAFVEVKI